MFQGQASGVPVGTKLEDFYLSLYAPPGKSVDIERVIECMHDLEGHQPLRQYNETNEVVDEIVKDCRKKCAQQLRAPFAEVIRNVIASCRKRLVSKAALDSESSFQHNQRHLNTLIELLGSWSNIVAQSVEYSFSRTLTRQILSPLYTRIVEASLECFKTFKRDKELDQWGSRLLDESVDINVASLDFLVSQVSGMKELLHQHYGFLYRHFVGYDTDYPSLEATPSGTVDSLLIVSTEELLHWRELDALYVTMEFGFVNRATQEALKETTLLQIEENVFIPQCIEDIFFILSKVTHRALSTGSESNVMGVGNRVLETIRFTPPEDYDKHSFLYRLATNKAFFGRCIERKSVSSKALGRILNGPKRNTNNNTASNSVYNTGHNSAHHTPQKGGGGHSSGFTTPNKNGSTQSTNNTTTTTNNTTTAATTTARTASSTTSLTQMLFSATEEAFTTHTTPGSPAVDLVNTISGLTSTSLSGVNWWLSDQLSPYLGTLEGEGSEPGGVRHSVSSGGIAMKDSTPSPHNGSSSGVSNNGISSGNGSHSAPTSTGSSHAPLPPPGRVPLPPTTTTTNTTYNTPNKHKLKSPTHTSNSSTNSIYTGVNSTSTVYNTPSTSTNSILSLDELLLNALVGDEHNDHDGYEYNHYTEPLTLSDFDTIYTNNTLATLSSTNTSTDTNTTPLCTDAFEQSMRIDELRARLTLSEDDWVVQLNTLCTIVSCTDTLRSICSSGIGIADIYKPTTSTSSSSGNSGKANSSPIEIILQELTACESLYRNLLVQETKLFSRWIYTCHIELSLMCFCSLNFNINGEEMELRASHSVLHTTLRRCFGRTPLEVFERQQHDKVVVGNQHKVVVTRDDGVEQGGGGAGSAESADEVESGAGTFMAGSESRLSQGAYVVMLEELCGVLAAQLFDKLIHRAKFSEWGALLLYQEVIALTLYMEQLIDHMDPVHIRTVKASFDALNLALKILTLDAPGDIRRYNISSSVLSEEQVRAILGRRIDFSKEAVKNVKLNIT